VAEDKVGEKRVTFKLESRKRGEEGKETVKEEITVEVRKEIRKELKEIETRLDKRLEKLNEIGKIEKILREKQGNGKKGG